MRQLVMKCLRDEQGTEIVEYALLVGLIVVGALGIMGTLGVKIVKRWELICEDI